MLHIKYAKVNKKNHNFVKKISKEKVTWGTEVLLK